MRNPLCTTCARRRRKCQARYRWDKQTKSHTQICNVYRVSVIALLIEWVKEIRKGAASQEGA